MVPSGSPTPIGGSSSISPALLRSNSAILGSQGGSTPPQGTYSSLVSPRGQYNVNVLANSPSVSSLLHQTFGNGGSSYSLSGLGGFQRGSIDPMAESNTVTMVRNDAGFTPSFAPANMVNSGSSGQVHIQQIPNLPGNASLSDQQRSLIQQKFQHFQHSMQQFPVSHNQAPQQPQSQSIRGGMGAMAPVKLEPQVGSDQIGPTQKLQKLHSLGRVKVEPQQNQIGRGMAPVKIENQHSDQASFLQQQQRQQQLLQMSKQPSQATIAQLNCLQQHRFFQLQQQQQQQQHQQKQQLLRTLPHQQLQVHQQFEQQNFPVRPAAKPVYEPGTCARRLTQYMYQQQHRPNDNNIEFWRKFVAEFFAPNARKRWCFSLYGNSRQTGGVFPQDLWCCGICNRKPSRGFETTVEVLPRLFKIKYDSGTLEELLYVDMPREYHNQGGQIVLDYAKATQESVFEHLRVVRDGQLRIVFSPDLKICSWEFCARRHEELIPRRLIIPQVSQLGAAAQKYQACAQNASSNSSTPDLESNCNMFLASARQLAKALEVPLVNDLGYTKRYVRCLQISEVVNSMKDLIDRSRMSGKGPMESLAQFSLRARPFSGSHGPAGQLEDQQQITGSAMNNGHHSAQASLLQPSTSSGVASANSSHGTMSTTTSATDITGLLRQSSMNSRIENGNNPGSPYTGTLGQIPSAGSSTTLPQAQLNPSSPFSSATPSSPNNATQSSSNMATASATANHVNTANSPAQISMQQQSSLSNEVDPNESQSSVEKIIQEIMSSSQYSGISADSEGNNTGDMLEPTQRSQKVFSGSNCLTGSAVGNNNNSPAGGVFENLGSLNGLSAATSGARGSLGNNSGALNGRLSMPLIHQGAGMTNQKQELATRFMNQFGAVNGFFDHQFD